MTELESLPEQERDVALAAMHRQLVEASLGAGQPCCANYGAPGHSCGAIVKTGAGVGKGKGGDPMVAPAEQTIAEAGPGEAGGMSR